VWACGSQPASAGSSVAGCSARNLYERVTNRRRQIERDRERPDRFEVRAAALPALEALTACTESPAIVASSSWVKPAASRSDRSWAPKELERRLS
jgi:hypothetical protein